MTWPTSAFCASSRDTFHWKSAFRTIQEFMSRQCRLWNMIENLHMDDSCYLGEWAYGFRARSSNPTCPPMPFGHAFWPWTYTCLNAISYATKEKETGRPFRIQGDLISFHLGQVINLVWHREGWVEFLPFTWKIQKQRRKMGDVFQLQKYDGGLFIAKQPPRIL